MTISVNERRRAGLPLSHLLLAVAVTGVWGTNFVVIKSALNTFPPLLFAFLRFVFVLFPAVLFLPRPKTAWANLAAYGALIGGGQFGLLYVAMRGHITPGLASLVVQCQVFFTIGLSIWKNGERVATGQWLAIALATLGLVTIAVYGGGDATPLGLSLVVLAGFCWACANIIAKSSPGANMLGYVVWASIFALPPLFVLSLAFEGSDAALHALISATPWAWTALFWQSVGNTLFGYAAWGWLLARHPAVYVTPTALLVPVFGMGASSLLLAEALQPWKIAAGSLIIAGLCINLALSRAPVRT